MSLTPAQYKKYNDHPLIVLFRNLAGGPENFNSKAALRAAIEEALPDELGVDFSSYREKLYAKGLQIVKQGKEHDERFELRGRTEQHVANFLDAIDAADHIVAPEPDPTPEELDSIMEATDQYSDMVGGDMARAEAKEAEEARAIVEKAKLA